MPNWKKLITSGSNAVLNDITASGEILIPQYVEHLGDTDTKLGFSANNTVVLVTGGSTRLKANNSGVEITGSLSSSGPAVLNEITASSDVLFEGGLQLEGQFNAGANIVPQTDNIGSVGTSALTFNNGRFTNFTIDSTLTVSNITLSGGITKAPMMISTNGEVPLESITNAFVPFSSINTMDQFTVNGYYQFAAPYDGTVQKIMVHPHTNATAGTSTIQLLKNGSNLGESVQETISATRGTVREFTFGDTYSFSKSDKLNLKFNREESDRATGFGFTIVFEMNTTT